MKPVLGSQIQLGHPSIDGLVGCWLMNEGSGNIIQDLSGNGRHGTAVGATGEISWSTGQDGPVVEFVGDTKAAYQFSPITFLSTDRWTLVWSMKTDGDAAEGVVLGEYDTSDDYIFISAGSYVRFTNSLGASKDITVNVASAWHTLAYVADGTGNITLYVDGKYQEKVTGATTSFILDSIGNGYNSDNYTYDGQVSHVSAYNRALSASEIADLYREPFAMFYRDPIELWSAATQGGAAPSTNDAIMTCNTGFWGATF